MPIANNCPKGKGNWPIQWFKLQFPQPVNPQPYLLEPLEPMKLPESKCSLDFPEPMKLEETQATTAAQEMAEENTETSEEEEMTPIMGTLQGLQSEEIPQYNLQLAADFGCWIQWTASTSSTWVSAVRNAWIPYCGDYRSNILSPHRPLGSFRDP